MWEDPFVVSNMKMAIAFFGSLFVLASLFGAAEAERFVKKLKLPSGQTAVIAEGEFEPRSTGSYSVRLYADAGGAFPADHFLGGLVHERDGCVEKVVLEDVDGDGRAEIVVLVRCAGTGSYLSAQAYAVHKKELTLQAVVAGLPPAADAVSALRKAEGQRP